MGTLDYQNPQDSQRERKGLLREWFGPSKDEVWKQLADGIGADFVAGGFWKGSKVVARVEPWEVTLDTFAESHGETSSIYTRMRAPFVNADGFRFQVYRTSIFSKLGEAFGMQDLTIGDPAFDEAFVIKSNDPRNVRRLLARPRLRELIARQPTISIEIKDDEGIFRRVFPPGVDELYFRVAGVIKDINRLEQLFELFAETLDALCEIGSAYRDNPGVRLT